MARSEIVVVSSSWQQVASWGELLNLLSDQANKTTKRPYKQTIGGLYEIWVKIDWGLESFWDSW